MTLEQRLAEALRLLYDNQNGCPLPKYEKQWNRAMELSKSALAEFESVNPLSEFQHTEDCPKYEFHLQAKDGEYRAQCAGCGATTPLTAHQAEAWNHHKTIPTGFSQNAISNPLTQK